MQILLFGLEFESFNKVAVWVLVAGTVRMLVLLHIVLTFHRYHRILLVKKS